MSSKEAQRKTEEYRQKLNKELYTVIEEEKVRDEERNKMYEDEKDTDEKLKLENQFTAERAETSSKIQNMTV